MTGRVIRLPAARDAAAQRLTVRQAFAAVRRGDLDAEAVDQVQRGRAGTLADYRALQELIWLVARAKRHSGAT